MPYAKRTTHTTQTNLLTRTWRCFFSVMGWLKYSRHSHFQTTTIVKLMVITFYDIYSNNFAIFFIVIAVHEYIQDQIQFTLAANDNVVTMSWLSVFLSLCVFFFFFFCFFVRLLFLNGACCAMVYFIRPLVATPSKHTLHTKKKDLSKFITHIKERKSHAAWKV